MINAQGIAIAGGLVICNRFCHKCRTETLEFNGHVDKRECAHMVCSHCGRKEYRKAYKVVKA